MGCCGGDREKFGNLSAEQKWDYIVWTLPTGCGELGLTHAAES
jgi:hypothetical protein